MKKIIINADDFGLSESATHAIAEAFRKKLISDTTMLANGKAFNKAVEIAKESDFIDKIGVHFNLTDGVPLTDEVKNCPAFCENGFYHKRINRLKPLNQTEKEAVYKELTAQVKRIAAAGINIDHADSHHHIHTAVFIAPIVFRVCAENNIDKIRLHRNIGNIPFYKKYAKDIYNKNLIKKGFKTTVYFGSLKDTGNALPNNLEIMVHPDYNKDGILIDRREFIDGIPSGVELLPVADSKGITLQCYGDL